MSNEINLLALCARRLVKEREIRAGGKHKAGVFGSPEGRAAAGEAGERGRSQAGVFAEQRSSPTEPRCLG